MEEQMVSTRVMGVNERDITTIYGSSVVRGVV